MPVIIVGAEKNLAALRSRLFSGKVSNAAVHEVSDAIRTANPHVDLDALQPGTVLTVPDHPKVSLRGDVSLDGTSKQAIGAILETIGATLEQLTAAARSREVDHTGERKQLAKALTAKELDAAAREDKTVGAALTSAQDGIAAEEAQAKDRTAALDKARAEWSSELEALKKLLPD
jgi:hypothetical protein